MAGGSFMKILAIDFNSLMNRSFFAIRTLTAKDGTPTNALYGFIKTYQKLIKTYTPDVVIAAYDMHAPTFRHRMYADYKGTRSGMADELRVQMPLGREFVELAGGTVFGIEGWEADDILGTVARWAEDHGESCIIATGDRDSFQLISDSVSVNLATNKGDVLMTPQEISEQYGVKPMQMIEIKSLMGDASDNIPGVKGIGEKTAGALIRENGSLQNILDHLDTVQTTPRIKKLIAEHKEEALLSHTLGTICRDAPIPQTPDQLTGKSVSPALADFLRKYSMEALIASFGLDQPVAAEEKPAGQEVTVLEEPAQAETEEKLNKMGSIYYLLRDDSLLLLTGEGEVSVYKENREPALVMLLQSELPLVTFDAKQTYKEGFSREMPVKNTIEDLLLAAYLLSSSDKSYSLSEMCSAYLPGRNVQAEDGYASLCLLPELRAAIQEVLVQKEMDYLYREIELPLCEVLASMEVLGFAVDMDGIAAFGKMLDEQIEQLKVEINDLAGVSFNFNSTQQLADVLFNRLGLPPQKKTKSGYSTNAEVLEALRGKHPIIEKILEYRKLTKLSSTYVVGLTRAVQPDGRIHSTFNQTETRTGRISSAEPNVQNIPVRTKLGAEMRKFFVAREGWTLVDADYSQIELRILAHISGDENMIAGFKDGADIHRMTASQVFRVPFEEVPASLRSRAKAINFGIVYGISGYSLSQDIGVTVKEAQQYINDYLHTYAGVDRYMKESVEKAREKGYVETLFHRPRYLPDILSKKPAMRGFSERVAMNMPIQGTAADIIKLAMIRVYRRLQQEGMQAKLILQVHDELLVEAPKEEAERVREIVVYEMEHVVNYAVELLSDAHIGDNWYLAKG
jgi:DNA polymerase-1